MNSEPIEIKPGVYRGQTQTQSGETVYCYIVPKTRFWDTYCQAANLFPQSIADLSTHLSNSIQNNTVTYNSPYRDYKRYKIFGFDSEKKFDEFISWLGAKTHTIHRNNDNIISVKKDKKKIRSLCNIRGAISEISDYSSICYLSRSEDFFLNEQKQEPDHFDINISNFIDQYQDLIMCVGLNLPENSVNHYNVRGIFRNPYSMLEGSYKEVSMAVHGFMAAVMKKYYPTVQEERVDPMYAMGSLIAQTLERSDIRFDEGKHYFYYDRLKHLNIEQFGNAGGVGNYMNIKVDALSKYYYEPHHFFEKKNNAKAFKKTLNEIKSKNTNKDENLEADDKYHL